MLAGLAQLVDGLGEGEVEIGKATKVVGAQPNGDRPIHVAPVGVVIHGLGDESNLSHEAPGAHKVGKAPLAFKGAVYDAPCGQGLLKRLDGLWGEQARSNDLSQL